MPGFVGILAILITCGLVATTSAISTRSRPPVIASVVPSFGSVEGGSRVTIAGSNFAMQGMFTSRAIFVGGQELSSQRVRQMWAVTISSTGNSTYFGDLTSDTNVLAGCSSAHGGLQ